METIIWGKCVEFHGHECGGLTIGYKAALYAIDLLGLATEDNVGSCCISSDEEVVCIAENDACGIDAIQVILGCSIGKGNLLFHMRGKQAFSFYNRKTGKSVRLLLKPRPEGMSRQESFDYLQGSEAKSLFEVKEAVIPLPIRAKIFKSIPCSCCGEITSENMIRIEGNRKLCLDCYQDYNRFDI